MPLQKVVCGLLRNENRVLIGKRLDSNPKFGGFWEFPGGKVEGDENIYDAIKREFKEEFDIEIQPLHQFKSAIDDEVELIPIICNFVSGKAKMLVHSEISFVELKQLKEYKFTPLTDDIIKSLVGSYNIFFSTKRVKKLLKET